MAIMLKKAFGIVGIVCFILALNHVTLLAAEIDAPVIVVIDPGHGGVPGETEANGGANYHDVYEKDLNLETALAMKKELEEYQGIEVYITRENDVEMSLKERAEFAKEKNADMFISIHYNASADHLFYGSEVWISAFGEFYANGYGLATHFMNQFREAGFVDKGIKTRIGESGSDYYGVIRHCAEFGITGIIVEHCYLDDDVEFKNVDTVEKQRIFGVRDAVAVAEYYGLDKDSSPEKIVPAPEIPIPDAPVLPDDTEPQNIVCSIQSFDEKTGSAQIIITAEEKESRILYYSYSVDGGKNFSRLSLWDGEDTMKLEIPIGKEAAGTLQVRLYNNYNLKGDSNLISFDYRKKSQKSDKKESYDLEDAYEIKILPDGTEETEKTVLTDGTEMIDIVIIILSLIFFVLAGVFVSLLVAMHWNKKMSR